MAYLPKDTLLQRISALEDAVRALNMDYICVQTALEDAQQAVARLSVEKASRHAILMSLESELASLRLNHAHARSQEILAGFPHELLRAIFLCAQDGINDIWAEDMHLWSSGHWNPLIGGPFDCSYDRNDVRLPFVLAAVNRRWRSVVLDVPDLWSFVGVPGVNDDNGATIREYVRLLLSRSQTQGLDIVLAWPHSRWEQSLHYRPILDAIGAHTHRWRRDSLTIPAGTPADATQFLRLPMHRLESLTLPENDDSFLYPLLAARTYLPDCPRLRSLRNHWLAEPISRTMPKLTVLTVSMSHVRPSLFWEALHHLPALQHLNVDFHGFCEEEREDDNAINAGPPGRLRLPHLRGLGLMSHYDALPAWFGKLDMPRLQHFRIWDIVSLVVMTALLDNIASTVATVTVYGPDRYSAEHLHNLAPLRAVRHLVLREFLWFGPALARALASREAARFPRLETVRFEHGRLDSAQAAQLADFLHVQHADPTNDIVISLVAEPEHVPDWLLRQYGYIRSKTNDAPAGSQDSASSDDSD